MTVWRDRYSLMTYLNYHFGGCDLRCLKKLRSCCFLVIFKSPLSKGLFASPSVDVLDLDLLSLCRCTIIHSKLTSRYSCLACIGTDIDRGHQG